MVHKPEWPLANVLGIASDAFIAIGVLELLALREEARSGAAGGATFT